MIGLRSRKRAAAEQAFDAALDRAFDLGKLTAADNLVVVLPAITELVAAKAHAAFLEGHTFGLAGGTEDPARRASLHKSVVFDVVRPYIEALVEKRDELHQRVTED